MSHISTSQKLKNAYPAERNFRFGKSGCMTASIAHSVNSDCQDTYLEFRLDDVLKLVWAMDYELEDYCPCKERAEVCDLILNFESIDLENTLSVATASANVIYQGLKCLDDFRRDPPLEWRVDHVFWATLPVFLESTFLDYFLPFLEPHQDCAASLRITKSWGF